MSKRSIRALREALTSAPGDHLDDATLAMLITAEAAGEEVEKSFAEALAHIDVCAQCAEAFDQLAEMMSAALAEMSAAAALVPPQEVYEALLAKELEREGLAATEAGSLAEKVARGLPLVLTDAPRQAQLDEALVAAAMEQARGEAATPTKALVRAVQQTVSALGLFLQGKAESIWRRDVVVASSSGVLWNRFQLWPAPVLRERMVSEWPNSREWSLFERSVGDPPTTTVRARVERLSSLSCRLVVRVEASGEAPAEGVQVRLKYGPKTVVAITDVQGVARFEPLPVASVPGLTIELEAD